MSEGPRDYVPGVLSAVFPSLLEFRASCFHVYDPCNNFQDLGLKAFVLNESLFNLLGSRVTADRNLEDSLPKLKRVLAKIYYKSEGARL
jgi:hypothetical protein